MVIQDDIVGVFLSPQQMQVCAKHAELCSIGGRSHIHRDSENRMDNLSSDQFVGQVCTSAATMWLGGSFEKGFNYYDSIRRKQNENPYEGDGGDDIPPYRVDVKGSMVRNGKKDFLTYNLLVRPKERHDGFVYVMALYLPETAAVALVGWITEEGLPAVPESGGIFDGAYRMSASDLNPMTQLKARMPTRSESLKKISRSG